MSLLILLSLSLVNLCTTAFDIISLSHTSLSLSSVPFARLPWLWLSLALIVRLQAYPLTLWGTNSAHSSCLHQAGALVEAGNGCWLTWRSCCCGLIHVNLSSFAFRENPSGKVIVIWSMYNLIGAPGVRQASVILDKLNENFGKSLHLYELQFCHL